MKSKDIRFINPDTDLDFALSEIHNRPREDLLKYWKEIYSKLKAIARATGTSLHDSRLPFWGNTWAIGPMDTFVEALKDLDNAARGAYAELIGLLSAASSNVNYLDATTNATETISRRLLIASNTAHPVATSRDQLYGDYIFDRKGDALWYLSTVTAKPQDFIPGEHPILCYKCNTYRKAHKGDGFSSTDLQTWQALGYYINDTYGQDVSLVPWQWKGRPGQPWGYVRSRAWPAGEGHGCVGSNFSGEDYWDCYTDLDEDENEGQVGRPFSFQVPTIDLWRNSGVYNLCFRIELRFSYKYHRTFHFYIYSGGQVWRYEEHATEDGRYLPTHGTEINREFKEYNTAVAYYYGTLFLTIVRKDQKHRLQIYRLWWDGSRWRRPVLGYLGIPDSIPHDSVASSSISKIPGTNNQFLVLLSIYKEDGTFAKNYWKIVSLHTSDDWKNYGPLEVLLDENGNEYTSKMSVCSMVPIFNDTKLVVDFNSQPDENIKGIYVRELKFVQI